MGSEELIMGDDEERKKMKEKKRRESTWSLPPPHSTPSPLFFFDPFLLGGAVLVPQLPHFIPPTLVFSAILFPNASHCSIIQSFISSFRTKFFYLPKQNKKFEYCRILYEICDFL